jgi:diguanylate cyclase (GGDEF)-like protein
MIGLGCAALGLILSWASESTVAAFASIFFVSVISGMLVARASSFDLYFTVGLDAATLVLLIPSSEPQFLIPLWVAGTFVGRWLSQGDLQRALRTVVDVALAGLVCILVLRLSFQGLAGVQLPDVLITSAFFFSGAWVLSVFFALVAYAMVRVGISAIRLRISRRIGLRRAMCAIGWARALLLLLLTFAESTLGGLLAVRLVHSFPGSDLVVGLQAIITLLALAAFGVSGLIRTEAAWHRANALAHMLAEHFENSSHAAINACIVQNISQAMPAFTVVIQPAEPRSESEPATNQPATDAHTIERCNVLISPQLTAWYGQFQIHVSRRIFARPFNRSDVATLDALAAVIQEKLLTVEEVNHLSDQANTDPLTGLLNYRGLRRALLPLDSPQPGNPSSAALVFLDLDSFKQVNDTFGHRAGNAVLQEIGQRISAGIRKPDVAARIGGDEFVAVLYGVTDREQAESAAARLTHELSKPVDVAEGQIAVRASMGVALSTYHDKSSEELLALADQRMYAAKELHGSSDEVPELEGAVRNEAAEYVDAAAIKAGIESGNMHVYYQPVVDVETGTIIAVEGLVRPGPGMPLCTAEQLVTAAHKFGLVDTLTHYVFTTAIADFAEFRSASSELTDLHLNIDASQLLSGPFLAEFEQWQAAKPMRIVLEINERWIDAWSRPIQDQLRQSISSHNLNLAIDDFGRTRVGFLAFLGLPINVVKVDKSVIDAYAVQRAGALISGMVTMAQRMGIELVFEGVETHEQLEFLRNCGGTLVQGFLYSKPVPRDEFLKLLRTGVERPEN